MAKVSKEIKVVGITGGIGSGKTTMAKVFKSLGVPVYHADKEAKALMNRSKVIRRQLTKLFGENTYESGQLNRSYLRDQIFNDKQLLSKMNAIVHPEVGAHFQKWLSKQDSGYVLKEVAIIFENNLQNQYDYIITVVADKADRINRVMERDGVTKAEVEVIISNQLSDNEKIQKSDFIIYNNNLSKAKLQVQEIHQQILKIIR